MMNSRYIILLISDNPEYSLTLSNKYSAGNNTPIIIETAGTHSEGLIKILNGKIKAVLLHLPQAALFEAIRSLRESTVNLPIIALVSPGEKDAGIMAIRAGAHNYLSENTVDIVSVTRSIRYAAESCKLEEELKTAKLTGHEHEKCICEFKRLRSIIDQYGIAIHELNQPLTALLGSIYLMKLDKDDPEKISRHVERIDVSSKRISNVIKKIQELPNEKNNQYLGSASFKNPDPKPISSLEVINNNFDNLNHLFRMVQARYNGTAG